MFVCTAKGDIKIKLVLALGALGALRRRQPLVLAVALTGTLALALLHAFLIDPAYGPSPFP